MNRILFFIQCLTDTMKQIDLRSDTVTRPSKAMRSAMAAAEVGDDVYGEDPTVNKLEERAAGLLGTQAALFVSSGTQSNLLALLSHCERGDEYIAGQTAHTYKYEGGGGAVLGSIQPQPLEFLPDGTLDLDQVANAVKPADFHFARTRLLCLENTCNGLALPLDYFPKVRSIAEQYMLSLHLDGARLLNAAVKQEIAANEISRYFDSISICLSKGLGAPVGSILCSTTEIIHRARRWRKVLGGGMRQAGILAAAGLFALDNNVNRLQEDHENAALLAQGLSGIDKLTVSFPDNQTNMVFVDLQDDQQHGLANHLRRNDILIHPSRTLRLVTHMDIEKIDIHRVIQSFQSYFSKGIDA